jgi:hypothetical protein
MPQTTHFSQASILSSAHVIFCAASGCWAGQIGARKSAALILRDWLGRPNFVGARKKKLDSSQVHYGSAQIVGGHEPNSGLAWSAF